MDNNRPVTPASVSPVTTEVPITLGEPPVGDVQNSSPDKASIINRFVAVTLDGFVVGIVCIPLIILGTILKQPFIVYLVYPLAFAYQIYFTWKYGATLGKKWMHLRVVSANGQPLNLMQVFLREIIGKFLSGLVFDLGYAWAFWDKDKQAWHDKIANTYVIATDPRGAKASKLTVALMVGLAVVFPIIIIGLSVAAAVFFKPAELMGKTRDSVRIADLTVVSNSIKIAQAEASTGAKLCGNEPAPCVGSSDSGSRAIDGSGWVRADLSSQVLALPKLPLDPLNSGISYYMYCSDGMDWEVNASLESKGEVAKAENDNGDNPKLYELGTNLTLCPTN